MVEANFVVAKKGHGGGFVMAVSPSKLTILDVISAVGFSMEEAPCVFGWHKCSNELPCPLHPVWKQLKNYFTEWSTQTTFEDIRLEYAHADVTKLFADRALANTKNISSARKTVQNS